MSDNDNFTTSVTQSSKMSEIKISLTGPFPGDYEGILHAFAELGMSALSAHAFPGVTTTDLADTLVHKSEQWRFARQQLNEVKDNLQDIQRQLRAQAEEDAYRENALRDYAETLQTGHRDKILLILTAKVIKQDPIPSAA